MASTLDEPLAATGMLLRFHPGEMIFREGEEAQGVYILHEGSADLVFAARNGRAKPLRRAEAGQILGLSAVVTARRHDCTAVAATACEIGFLGHDELLRSLDECPAVRFRVLRFLSSDVNAAYDDMRLMAAR